MRSHSEAACGECRYCMPAGQHMKGGSNFVSGFRPSWKVFRLNSLQRSGSVFQIQPTWRSRMTIFEALRISHDRQREYIDAVLLTNGDSEERRKSYQRLKDELLAHETAEERHFYIPLMAHDNGVDLSRHAIAEHHEMDELLEKLDEIEMSSSSWLTTARELGDKVLHHLEEEERRFFQMAGKLLSDAQKTEPAGLCNREFDQLLDAGWGRAQMVLGSVGESLSADHSTVRLRPAALARYRACSAHSNSLSPEVACRGQAAIATESVGARSRVLNLIV